LGDEGEDIGKEERRRITNRRKRGLRVRGIKN
jgi:hypothetical protein